MRTDFIAVLLAVLMLFALHCDGAIFLPDRANTDLTAGAINSGSLTFITNALTICMWHSQANAPGGDVIFRKLGTQFGIQDGIGPLDFIYNGLNSPPDPTQHWRSTANYKTTNNIKFLALTFTFGTGSSMTVYSNMLSVGGSWISGTTGNVIGSNYVTTTVIGGGGLGPGRFPGYYSEVYIWNSILTRQQLELIYKSRIKGIGLQISPATLKLYCALDGSPNATPVIPSSSNAGKNLFVDRSGNGCHFQWDDVGTTDPQGMAERICSYYPNE